MKHRGCMQGWALDLFIVQNIEQKLNKRAGIAQHEIGFLGEFNIVGFGLILAGLLFEDHVTGVHDAGSDTVDGILLFLDEAKNVERRVGGGQLFNIINCLDLDLTQGRVLVVSGVG